MSRTEVAKPGLDGLFSHIHFRSATALVIANVIGAGVFTTTGFQAADLGNAWIILALWVLGGLLAYCGSLCFAELGAAMPEPGAEYVYLRESYGRIIGFTSAFVSLLAGFSAPIAAAVKSLYQYLFAYFPALPGAQPIIGSLTVADLAGVLTVWLLVGVHLRGREGGVTFNDIVTLIKVTGIVAIILAAAAFGKGELANLVVVSDTYRSMDLNSLLIAMSGSLIFVMFCYSGWNAAAYVASEIVDPQKTLPRALKTGTAIVTVIYVLLNIVYFYGADVNELAGKVEVGLVAARSLFGDWGAGLVTIVLGTSLLASASAMTMIGPRVYFSMGNDAVVFRGLTRTNRAGAPVIALILQGIVTTLIIVSGTVDQILSYAGFTLALMSALAVSCVIVLRVKRPELHRPFRMPMYPLPPVFFILVSVWTMFWAFQGRPVESTLALLTVFLGGATFWFATVWKRRRDFNKR